MSRNYYKYYEILFSLRKEYLKNKVLLDKLLSFISINSDKYTYGLKFKHRDNPFDSLLLILYKKDSFLRERINFISNMILNNSKNDGDYDASFLFYFLDDDVILRNNGDNSNLDPLINISNRKEFVDIYKDLIDSDIFRYGKFEKVISENEYISLNRNGILLYYYLLNSINDAKLSYDGINDRLLFDINGKVGINLEELLDTKIDRDIFPGSYIDLIDSNMDITNIRILEDSIVDNNGNKLVLNINKKKS